MLAWSFRRAPQRAGTAGCMGTPAAVTTLVPNHCPYLPIKRHCAPHVCHVRDKDTAHFYTYRWASQSQRGLGGWGRTCRECYNHYCCTAPGYVGEAPGSSGLLKHIVTASVCANTRKGYLSSLFIKDIKRTLLLIFFKPCITTNLLFSYSWIVWQSCQLNPDIGRCYWRTHTTWHHMGHLDGFLNGILLSCYLPFSKNSNELQEWTFLHEYQYRTN